jgi:hypothetical protein
MIITEDKIQVTTNLPQGAESSKFSIQANGKAFKILVGGIYAEKVMSIVRELMSNADDAHRRVKSTAPFEVRVPNSVNPTFSVRDYGCSMTHEFVMSSYSTLFESSKSASNDETGAFGLGAKAFLAYTDACTITCWMGGERRTYMIMLDADSIPTVTLVDRSHSSDLQGVEVSFAVMPSDFREFEEAVRHNLMAYPTPPNVVGADISAPVPFWVSADGKYRMYKNNGRYSLNYVCQGSALYPFDRGNDNIVSGYSYILTVPIGTTAVTASREAMTPNHSESAFMEAQARKYMGEFTTAIVAELTLAPTALERVKLAYKYADYKRYADRSMQPLFDLDLKIPQGLGHYVTSWFSDGPGKGVEDLLNVRYAPGNLSSHRILIGNPWDVATMPRRKTRIKTLVRNSRALWMVPDQASARELSKLLDLSPNHFMLASEIPDVHVAKRPSTPRPKVTTDVTAPWIVEMRGASYQGITDKPIGKSTGNVRGIAFKTFLPANKPLNSYTRAQAEKLLAKGAIKMEMNVWELFQAFLDKTTPNHVEYIKFSRFVARVPYDIRSAVLAHLSMGEVGVPLYHNQWTEFHQGEVKDANDLGDALYEKVRDKYPMLFQRNDDTVLKYMESVDSGV